MTRTIALLRSLVLLLGLAFLLARASLQPCETSADCGTSSNVQCEPLSGDHGAPKYCKLTSDRLVWLLSFRPFLPSNASRHECRHLNLWGCSCFVDLTYAFLLFVIQKYCNYYTDGFDDQFGLASCSDDSSCAEKDGGRCVPFRSCGGMSSSCHFYLRY